MAFLEVKRLGVLVLAPSIPMRLRLPDYKLEEAKLESERIDAVNLTFRRDTFWRRRGPRLHATTCDYLEDNETVTLDGSSRRTISLESMGFVDGYNPVANRYQSKTPTQAMDKRHALDLHLHPLYIMTSN